MCSRMLRSALCLTLLAGPFSAAAEEEQAAASAEESLAPGEETEVPAAPIALAREGGTLLHGKLELSLENAIKMGLENNLSVQVERYAPLIAGHEESIAWGAYDPEFRAIYSYEDAQEPSANPVEAAFAGGTSADLNNNPVLSIRVLTPSQSPVGACKR